MTFAFLSPTPLLPVTATKSTSPAISMRCRRDLKKEKSLRNLEFARAHRKRVVRRFNRRAEQQATQNEDNLFLSDIYGTIRFGRDAEEPKKEGTSF